MLVQSALQPLRIRRLGLRDWTGVPPAPPAEQAVAKDGCDHDDQPYLRHGQGQCGVRQLVVTHRAALRSSRFVIEDEREGFPRDARCPVAGTASAANLAEPTIKRSGDRRRPLPRSRGDLLWALAVELLHIGNQSQPSDTNAALDRVPPNDPADMSSTPGTRRSPSSSRPARRRSRRRPPDRTRPRSTQP